MTMSAHATEAKLYGQIQLFLFQGKGFSDEG